MTFSTELKNRIMPTYQSKDLANEFYKPVLSEAESYKRVSAYFSSEGINLYSQGLDELFKNGGSAQFIISTNISEEDFNKIKNGYEIREKIKDLPIIIKDNILNQETQKNLGNVAFMIAQGCVEVKFALMPESKGIFHDKFGLIFAGGEEIFFTGSVNETKSGLMNNYESISVDLSWDNSDVVKKRIDSYNKRFERLWENEEEDIIVKDVTELVYEELAKFEEKTTLVADGEHTGVDEELSDFKGVSFRMDKAGYVIREDKSEIQITKTDRKLQPSSSFARYFQNDNATMVENISYLDVEKIIDLTKQRCKRRGIEVKISAEVKKYLAKSKYSISKYRILGEVLKDNDEFNVIFNDDFQEFCEIVQSQVSRPLKDLHLRAAFYQYRMARAANFSVPGAGKTAMLLGVFAYLNNKSNITNGEYVDKMVVISPINAFNSWREEFKKVFGNKKDLVSIDSQTSKSFEDDINIHSGNANLILVNYESVIGNSNILKKIINSKTMLIFDEVHRIKNPNGKQALAALDIVKNAKFKFVMTGTPIPNTYKDVYNFLHLLYSNEYNSFFGWEPNELENPSVREIEEINQKISPFFWRVNKKDLDVPIAEDDNLIVVDASEEQLELAESIYYNEKSSLARLIRLIQVSTNPSLLNKEIKYSQMGFSSEDEVVDIQQKVFEDNLLNESPSVVKSAKLYSEYNFENIVSPKFEAGIELIQKLVSENKKVIVWAIFVDTMKKIKKRLEESGIATNLVYGGVKSVTERQTYIDEFKNGSIQVMVSNPQTLGESVSLHESVHDAIYFEYNFNLTFMLQSRDRIHRLGLPANQYTQYHYLETRSEDDDSGRPGYIDQKIYARLKEKEQIMYDAIDNQNLSITYSGDEIMDAIKVIDNERQRIVDNRTNS